MFNLPCCKQDYAAKQVIDVPAQGALPAAKIAYRDCERCLKPVFYEVDLPHPKRIRRLTEQEAEYWKQRIKQHCKGVLKVMASIPEKGNHVGERRVR